jgi:uncharacterized tellurite resistance protein B-like protein
MLNALKKLFSSAAADAPEAVAQRLARSLAALLHEMTRVDMQVRSEDLVQSRAALIDLLAVDAARADALLEEAALPQNRLTSYHEPVTAINAAFTPAQKLRLIEHLWRVAHADDTLDVYEDHLVRKISDLLYVPHVQSMLARQRVREQHG